MKIHVCLPMLYSEYGAASTYFRWPSSMVEISYGVDVCGRPKRVGLEVGGQSISNNTEEDGVCS